MSRLYGWRSFVNTVCYFLLSYSSVYAEETDEINNAVDPVSYEHMMNWTFGLIIVLGLFFSALWFMRKMGALPGQSKGSMKVIAGLSLGTREKLVLVQLGEKQLVLGVTPGRIDNLLVLEGDDQLFQENTDDPAQNDFSQKLKQVMAGKTGE